MIAIEFCRLLCYRGVNMNKKLTIEKGTVQETLMIPLYGRKICNEVFPDLYNDPYANELIDRLEYDFSAIMI